MSCKCPKEDNDNGKGAIGYPEDYFWIDDTCNLHNVANIKTDGLYINPDLAF